jgi:predicted aspartyl protease
MIDYDKSYDPPALALSVTVAGVVHSRPKVTIQAHIDTGADITAIPTNLVDRLKLYPFGRIQIEDARAVKTQEFTYEAQLAIADGAMKVFEVVLTSLPIVILGRDWLQDYYLLLNGPELSFLLSETPIIKSA